MINKGESFARMMLRRFHSILSFGKLFKFLLGFAVSIQLIIITYNDATGYSAIESIQHFIIRFLSGTLFSMIAGFMMAYPNLLFMQQLNKGLPWSSRPLLRVIFQLMGTVLFAVVISVMFTYTSHWLSPYREEFEGVLISNMLIFSVVNIVLVIILEAWINYIGRGQAEAKSQNLQKELSQIKYEVLKSQINPHFMFNSLNVLSGLVSNDSEKAQRFIDEFSHIYRYVLEMIEHPVATLGKELEFMRSYLFLQQIRYGKDLTYTVNIPAALLERIMPPLSLQVVLENAIKHNIVNDTSPLLIEVYTEGDVLVVKNNMKPKVSLGNSTHLGLINLARRYEMVTDKIPEFFIDAEHYIAKLPLVDLAKDENTNH